MGKKGKQPSQEAKKKELNKTLAENSKTKEIWEMTTAEIPNNPEYQELKREYEKTQTLPELKKWMRRHLCILEDMRSRSSKEDWEDFLKWCQDPDFQFEFTWDEWAGKGSKEVKNDSDSEEEIEQLIQRAQNVWDNLFQRPSPARIVFAASRRRFSNYRHTGDKQWYFPNYLYTGVNHW